MGLGPPRMPVLGASPELEGGWGQGRYRVFHLPGLWEEKGVSEAGLDSSPADVMGISLSYPI